MKESARSSTNAARKKTGFVVQENERPPIETKLDQLLAQTKTIAQDQVAIKDSLTQVKDSIREISDSMEDFEEQLDTVEASLEALKQQERSTVSNYHYVHKRSNPKVIIDLTSCAEEPSSAAKLDASSAAKVASPSVTKVVPSSSVKIASSSAVKIEAPKTSSTMRLEIKKLALKAAQNRQILADDIYDHMIQQVQKICKDYRQTSKRYGKTVKWEDVDKDTQDKLVQKTYQAIVDSDEKALFLNDCVDYWPIRFLVQQRWDGWTYYTTRKEMKIKTEDVHG